MAAILDSTTFYVESIISAILDLGRDFGFNIMADILDYDVIINYVSYLGFR